MEISDRRRTALSDKGSRVTPEPKGFRDGQPAFKPSVLAWARERLANTYRIAKLKDGEDRDGWLEDAAHWELIMGALVARRNSYIAVELWRDRQGRVEKDDTAASRGRKAYDEDCVRRPTYHDGTLRPTWEQLDEVARWSWDRAASDDSPADERVSRSQRNGTATADASQRATASLTGWQPIETAPKDGTRVLLLWRRGGVTDGRWDSVDGWPPNDGLTHWMPFLDAEGVSA